jgi:nucleoside-diphosphate-sugar epimerase
MKKYVVTGSLGYIGTNLCRSLTDQGHSIFHIDKKINRDINKIDWNEVFSFQPDGVFHLAAVSSIPECQRNHKEALASNVFAMEKVSDFCSSLSIPLVYASSQAVKGEPTGVYAISKILNEMYANKVLKSCVGLRFSNVYGGEKFEDKTSVIAKFLKARKEYLEGKESFIGITGTGNQTRDFVHVSNVVTSLVESMNYLEKTGPCKMVLEVSSGESVSINQIAEKISFISSTQQVPIRKLPDNPGVEHNEVSPNFISALELENIELISLNNWLLKTLGIQV